MSARRLMNNIYYFTIEDEGILSEAFNRIESDVFAITYKVKGTEDVFVATSDTKDAMDRNDIPYNLLAKEDGSRIALYHTALSREELENFEDSLKTLVLAHRGIGMACVGVNGESNLGFDLSKKGAKQYTYFTAPAGHTFIWRVFHEKEEARAFMTKLFMGDHQAMEWVEGMQLNSSTELASFH